MALTTNPDDPRLGHGVDTDPRAQNAAYLVLSDEERAQGFVRPVRRSYIHVGKQTKYPLRDLTDEEKERFAPYGYVKKEEYPESESPLTGRYWTQAELDKVGNGCRTTTTMGQAIAETYARNPSFYGATYCVHCQKHLPVAEFVWSDDGTVVGS
jgi:hypothetical protein